MTDNVTITQDVTNVEVYENVALIEVSSEETNNALNNVAINQDITNIEVYEDISSIEVSSGAIIQGPKGEKGDAAATIIVGSTTTGAAGSSASVTNSGTSSNVVLNFTVPIGNTGAQGAKGDQGDQGIQGDQGLQGDQGIQGIQGEQGLKGDTGDDGPQGLQGEIGAQGLQGDQGIQGIQGEQGLKGDTGDKGDKGDKGDTGNPGTDGDRYATTSSTSFTLGDSGNQTITVVDFSVDYSTGQSITVAYDVSNIQYGTVISYTAATGSLVFKKDSYDGSGTYAVWSVNLSGAVGIQGPQGIQGEKGDQGIQGIQGIQGEKGDTGEQGTQATFSITSETSPLNPVEGQAWFNSLNGKSYIYYDSFWVEVGSSLSGPQGDVGPAGPEGPQGIQGIQGEQGIQGIKGDTGNTGASGGITLSVTNAGSGSYTINGSANPTLSFIRGHRYVINVNASGHPFWIQTVSGAYSAENVYSTGVTNGGTDNGTIIFEVPFNAPQLYYVCQYHSSMAGSITVSDLGPQGDKGDTGDTGPTGPQGIQGLTGPAGPEKIVQIVRGSTSSIITATINSNTAVSTGLSATITPTSASNKILIFANQNGVKKSPGGTEDFSLTFRVLRGSNQVGLFGGATTHTQSSGGGGGDAGGTFIDSPATTSALTYSVNAGRTISNSNGIDQSAFVIFQWAATESTLLLMEVTP